MSRHPDELLADFQQYYGIDLWPVCQGYDPRNPDRTAALAWQLPSDGRVWKAVSPTGAYGPDVMLLRQLELDVRSFQWSFTEDAKDKSTAPEPITLPGEEEEYRRAEAEADSMAKEVAQLLGVKI